MTLSREDRPPTVLIVDDDRATRALLALAMEEEGYETVGAQNGEQAIEEFNRLVPNLVLMDAMMPEMDGFTCCERMRSLPEGRTVPILIITVLDDQESVDRAFSAGTTDYITKPIYWPVLCQRVRRLVQAGETEQQLALITESLERSRAWDKVTTAVLGLANSTETGSWQDQLPEVVAIAREALGGDQAGLWLSPSKLWIDSQAEGWPAVEAEAAQAALDQYIQKPKDGAEATLIDVAAWAALDSVFQCRLGMVATVAGTDGAVVGGVMIGRSQDKPWSERDQQRWRQLGQLLSLILF
ncbi:MAG: response regulator [Cyanobacteria bacterium P01_D01_bin.73]